MRLSYHGNHSDVNNSFVLSGIKSIFCFGGSLTK